MGYRFLDHTTDAIIEVEAESLTEAFVTAADATVDLTLDRGSVAEADCVEITAEGEDLYYLLYSWLEEVIFVLITRGFAIRRVEVVEARLSANGGAGSQTAGGPPRMMRARAHGEPIDLSRHGFKVEIKAPTFHDMEISETCRGVRMRFLLDL